MTRSNIFLDRLRRWATFGRSRIVVLKPTPGPIMPETLAELCRLGASWYHGVARCPNAQVAQRAQALLWDWGYTIERLDALPAVAPLTADEMMIASDAIDRRRAFEGLDRCFNGSPK